MSDSAASRRLFFALWPDRALQVALAEATRDVVLASGGRPIPAENFHITLAFLGSVPETRLSDVRAVGAAVAAAFASIPIEVSLETLEYWKKPRVLCWTAPGPASFGASTPGGVSKSGVASVSGSASMSVGASASGGAALADRLKSKLCAMGFAPDLKPFRAHVTLARKVAHPTRVNTRCPAVWHFSEFALVESRTEAQGSVYRVVESYPFGVP